MTVYIDVLFVINFVVNYVLLLITGKIMRREKSYVRLVTAAIVGALYACFMFFPQIKFLYGCAFKIIASFLLILIAYGAKNAVLTVKTALVFYLSSFLFGGVTLALFYFTDAGLKYGGALNNGIFYFELPWKILFFSCLIAYIAMKTGFAIYKRDKNLSYRRIRVEICRNSADLNALVDTGNLLIDPITNSPVVVAELESVKKLLPGALIEVFREKKENDLETVSKAVKNTDFERRIRMIPFTSLGAENGIMLGFKPDSITVGKSVVSNVCIGICARPLSNGHSYNALISPEALHIPSANQNSFNF